MTVMIEIPLAVQQEFRHEEIVAEVKRPVDNVARRESVCHILPSRPVQGK